MRSRCFAKGGALRTDIDSKETVRLPRHPQVYLADKFDSLEKWHEFYDPIQRCRGVTTYMLNHYCPVNDSRAGGN